MITIAEFIERHEIKFSTTRVARNPHMTDMPVGSTHWRCKITVSGRSMSMPFSQGPAHTDKPTAVDVLNCLASDAASVDNARSFEEWASDLGYEPDSRKAERTYRVIEKQRDALKRVLGAEAMRVLLYGTERE